MSRISSTRLTEPHALRPRRKPVKNLSRASGVPCCKGYHNRACVPNHLSSRRQTAG
jgi:hypothetical protein